MTPGRLLRKMSGKEERARIVEFEPEVGTRPTSTMSRSSIPVPVYADEESTPGEYVAIILENRLLIALVAAAALFMAGAYGILVAPTWRSDILLPGEGKTKGLAGLDDTASAFRETTPADTQI